MLKKRIIPVLMVKNGKLCMSKNFSKFQFVGNPFEQVKRLSTWNVDEIIYLDISEKKNKMVTSRIDKCEEFFFNNYELISYVNKYCFIPITWGGNVNSYKEAEKVLKNGSDKVYFNSAMINNKSIIKRTIKQFGSQAVIIGVDVKKINSKYRVFYNRGSKMLNITLKSHLENIQDLGPGEILIHSIDRDGIGDGFDLELIRFARKIVDCSITILGGAGNYSDFVDAAKAGADGIASGNIWHIKDNVEYNIKKTLKKNNIKIRI